jgi:hypothetical protein
MNSPSLGLRVSAVIFAVVGVLHALRLAFQIEVVIGGHSIPLTASAAGLALAVALYVWFCKLAADSQARKS